MNGQSTTARTLRGGASCRKVIASTRSAPCCWTPTCPATVAVGGRSVEDQRRVGIVGYGLAGRVFHGQLIKAEPGLRVAAVVTRNPQRRAQAATEHPGVAIHDTLDEMLGAGGLDLVVVASPTDAHADGALASIAA